MGKVLESFVFLSVNSINFVKFLGEKIGKIFNITKMKKKKTCLHNVFLNFFFFQINDIASLVAYTKRELTLNGDKFLEPI